MNEQEGTENREVANKTATGHAIQAYLPLPRDQRSGISLSLSGGGYRAALFHLGSLRRLNELGVLGQIDTITSVSGGTIFAAQFATYVALRSGSWPPASGRLEDWEAGVARPMRSLAQTNIRSGALLSRLKPRNWFNSRAALEALTQRYSDSLTPLELRDLPTKPRFVFLASDMEFGEQWVFDTGRQQVGSRTAGYLEPPYDGWTLAAAVAASSCVPGVFPALRVPNDPDLYSEGEYDQPDRTDRLQRMDLVDGGIYDNLGLEPAWRDHRTILVSDGAPTYRTLRMRGLVWRSLRHALLLLDQATEVRKRWLVANYILNEFEGAFWSIGSEPSHYDPPPGMPRYSDALVRDTISSIRIDLDSFTSGEIAILENHGYLMADAAIRRHAPELICEGSHPIDVPHPDWMDEERATNALRRSHRVLLFGRGRWR